MRLLPLFLSRSARRFWLASRERSPIPPSSTRFEMRRSCEGEAHSSAYAKQPGLKLKQRGKAIKREDMTFNILTFNGFFDSESDSQAKMAPDKQFARLRRHLAAPVAQRIFRIFSVCGVRATFHITQAIEFIGVPRSTKMGNIALLRRYDRARFCAAIFLPRDRRADSAPFPIGQHSFRGFAFRPFVWSVRRTSGQSLTPIAASSQSSPTPATAGICNMPSTTS